MLYNFLAAIQIDCILVFRLSKRPSNKSAPSNCDQQTAIRKDDRFVQSSACLVETNPEGDHTYENIISSTATKSSAEKIIHPVYATVEFLPRASVTEEMARTLPNSKCYLDADRVVYAEIEMKKFE